jgi:hypothetical protein
MTNLGREWLSQMRAKAGVPWIRLRAEVAFLVGRSVGPRVWLAE